MEYTKSYLLETILSQNNDAGVDVTIVTMWKTDHPGEVGRIYKFKATRKGRSREKLDSRLDKILKDQNVYRVIVHSF